MPAEDKPLKLQFRSARSAVITALLRNEQLSRSELSEITGVSPAAITEVTQTFLQRGLLVELPSRAAGRRGRPTVQLQLQASHAYFAGIAAPTTATDSASLEGGTFAAAVPTCPGAATPRTTLTRSRLPA